VRLIRKQSILKESIDDVLIKMRTEDPSSEEYSQLLNKLERLIRLKDDESSNRVSSDTMAIVVGNLLGILIIVSYERNHVMVSRGINFLLRTKHQ
jgi:hypothetical protein